MISMGMTMALDAKVVAAVAGVVVAPVEGVALGTEVIAITTKVPL
jgi:hypothetical protein